MFAKALETYAIKASTHALDDAKQENDECHYHITARENKGTVTLIFS